MKTEAQKKLIKQLTNMFQFDQADLDFGIYRVMNQKREVIQKFLEKDLPDTISNTLSKFEDKSIISEMESSIYSHLLEFFNRYYDEGDFISQRRFREGAYAIPFEGEETKYYWANADQYYVKSSENFDDYQFSTTRGNVLFKLLDVAHERDNNKGDKKEFHLVDNPNIENPTIINGKLVIYFQYATVKKSVQGELNKYIVEKITNSLHTSSELAEFLPITEKPNQKTNSRLEKEIQKYTAKNTYDYFIHKNLKGFFEGELDNYLKNNVIYIDDLETENMKIIITKMRIIESVAKDIIAFLSQIEEFQKKLWLKKKFVVSTDYVITLDKIDEVFYEEISRNKKQIQRWKDYFTIDDLINIEEVSEKFLLENPYLTLDTAFFSEEFKEKLIASFDDVEETIPGLLINSDNFQAMNLLKNKYSTKIDTIYIDPPYNTDASQILYKNNYRHSSWMSLMYDRIAMGRKLLKREGIQTTAIDDFELKELYALLEMEFGRENFAGIISVLSNPSGRPREGGIAQAHEYLLSYKNTELAKIGIFERSDAQLKRYNKKDNLGPYEQRNLRRDGSNSDKDDGIKQWYPFFVDQKSLKWRIPKLYWNDEVGEWDTHEKPEPFEQVIWPKNDDGIEKNWRWAWAHVLAEPEQIYVLEQNSGLQIYYKFRPKAEGISPLSFWGDTKYSAVEYGTKYLAKIIPNTSFTYPKSIFAVQDALRITGMQTDGSIVLDYFAGSGTTGEAALRLMREDGKLRKIILIEMGKYFNSETMQRLTKAIYSKEWNKGRPIDRQGISYAFKYHLLESYEDSLNNIVFSNTTSLLDLFDTEFNHEYLLNYMFDSETKNSNTLLNINKFSNPFDYRMNISENGEKNVRKIDLIETFNYLKGISIKKNYQTISVGASTQTGELGKLEVSLKNGDEFMFKLIDGFHSNKRVLVVWRSLSNNLIIDSEVLNAVLVREKIDIDLYDEIFVNGDCNLFSKNQINIFQIESEIEKLMFETEGL